MDYKILIRYIHIYHDLFIKITKRKYEKVELLLTAVNQVLYFILKKLVGSCEQQQQLYSYFYFAMLVWISPPLGQSEYLGFDK